MQDSIEAGMRIGVGIDGKARFALMWIEAVKLKKY
jgi:hypothetical protein